MKNKNDFNACGQSLTKSTLLELTPYDAILLKARQLDAARTNSPQSFNFKKFLASIPKIELHIHIEGTLEPHMLFKFSQKNNITLPYTTIEDVLNAYKFNDLSAFIDIYSAGSKVLVTEQDFYDLTYAYLLKCQQDNVQHTEIFFDPQTHTNRGVAFKTVISGINNALIDGQKKLGISSKLILSILRDGSVESAMQTLEEALPFKHMLVAIGMSNPELGHPPSKFEKVFALARAEGLLTVAHAGEEAPAEYMWEAIKFLKISRNDHGVQCIHDPKLVDYLAETRLPLTLCPISNLKIGIVKSLDNYVLKPLLEKKLCVTVNSDDPSYFGAYIADNFIASQQALDLSVENCVQIVLNSIEASFLEYEEKLKMLDKVHGFLHSYS